MSLQKVSRKDANAQRWFRATASKARSRPFLRVFAPLGEVFLLIALLALGCDKPKDQPLNHATQQPAFGDAQLRALVERHNARVERLRLFYGQGVISLKWTNQSGSHSEQGNLEIWGDLPDRLAIRIYKAAIGEDFLHLGADGGRFWLLDPRAKPAEMIIVEHNGNGLFDGYEDGGLPLYLNPKLIVEMMGLAPLPTHLSQESYELSNDGREVIVTVPVSGGRGAIRMRFDRAKGFPIGVDRLDSQGELLLSCEIPIDRYETVARDETNPMDYPPYPMRLKIQRHEVVVDPDSGDSLAGQAGSISITFDDATARASDGRWTDKLFDMNRLIRRYEPRIRRLPERIAR